MWWFWRIHSNTPTWNRQDVTVSYDMALAEMREATAKLNANFVGLRPFATVEVIVAEDCRDKELLRFAKGLD